MSVFTPTRNKVKSKVHNSEYIRTENDSSEQDTKPAEPNQPAKPNEK